MRMRALLKWLGLLPLLLSYLLASSVACLLPASKKSRRDFAIRNTSFFSRLLLVLFGIRVHVKRRGRLRTGDKGRLIIANHVSYIDVLVISSLLPSTFITSVELKHTPVLGALARLGGCLFVERRKASGLKKEIESIACVLGQGFSVVLFPEGTTSNGDRVQQFKNSLFDAAIAAQADIFPVCLRYTAVNGERLTPRNRDAVFYYGGISFFDHFPKLLSRQSVDVEIVPLKTIKTHARRSRKDLAALAHDAISDAYRE